MNTGQFIGLVIVLGGCSFSIGTMLLRVCELLADIKAELKNLK